MEKLVVAVNLLGPFCNCFFLKEVVPVTELFIFFLHMSQIFTFIFLYICKFYTIKALEPVLPVLVLQLFWYS